MKDKKYTTEKCDPQAAWEQGTYQTGSTSPPKNWGGLIAVLLVMVIFLSGVSTALGLMNIRLFHQINSQEETAETSPVAFSKGTASVNSAPEVDSTHFILGFSGLAMPDVWQQYYDLPAGICVTDVDERSAAAGFLQTGDILTRAGEVPVSDVSALEEVLAGYQPGDTVRVTLYRKGQELLLDLTIDAE